VPKKGHVCPYQPKFKRRPDEPPPELKNASTQVEMDEFLVLRRLNLEIQGFPESYTSEATTQIFPDNVGAESHPSPPSSGLVVGTSSTNTGHNHNLPHHHHQPPQPHGGTIHPMMVAGGGNGMIPAPSSIGIDPVSSDVGDPLSVQPMSTNSIENTTDHSTTPIKFGS
jgi:hypothetical protein